MTVASRGMVIHLGAALLGIRAAAGCEAPPGFDPARTDFAPILNECIQRTSQGGIVGLKPGIYSIQSQVDISRPITLGTDFGGGRVSNCALEPEKCATLVISPRVAVGRGQLPIRVTSPNVRFDRISVRGFLKTSPDRSHEICDDESSKRAGGGVRVDADGFSMRYSSVSEISCYSAVEVIGLKSNLLVSENFIGVNGDHSRKGNWADGLTIRDASDVVVEGNYFHDNTDVQLIFGGCLRCSVKNNRFSHSERLEGGAFAELMLQAWPKTSGRFGGTNVTDNVIDCGHSKLCGFGLMIGSAPWGKTRASGGTVSHNSIDNARVAVNVDGLTGRIDIRDNIVRNSGGRFSSRCGEREWPSINVSPESRQFIADQDKLPKASEAIDSTGCLIDLP